MTMMDAVRTQMELSKRLLAGTATDAERFELTNLTEKLDGATRAIGNPNAVPAELATMAAGDFEKFLAEEQAALAKAPDLDRLALLRENVAGVRKQAERGATIYAVRVPVVEKLDPMDIVLRRLDEMEKKFDQRFRTGVGNPVAREPEAPAPAPAPEAPPAEQAKNALSKDAIDGFLTLGSVDELMALIDSLSAKAADENDDSDELRKLLDGTYDLAHLVTCAATVAQKAADLVEAAQSLEKAKDTRKAKPKKPFPGAVPPFGAEEDEDEKPDAAKKAKPKKVPFPPATDEEAPNGAPETDLDDDKESEDDQKGYGGNGKKKPPMAKAAEPDVTNIAQTDDSGDVAKFAWASDLSPDESVGDRFRAFKRACSSRQT